MYIWSELGDSRTFPCISVQLRHVRFRTFPVGQTFQYWTPENQETLSSCFNVHSRSVVHTVFPRSDAAATINFPLLALAATIRGRCLIEGGINYTLHDIVYCLAASIFDCVMLKSTIFGSDYC